MEIHTLPKPNVALTRDTLSSRNSSTERLSIFPEKLVSLQFPVERAESQEQHHSIQDHFSRIQSLAQEQKKLTAQLVKYHNKSGPATRCNHIRLTLLKFLRSETQLSLPPDLDNLPADTVPKVRQCISQGIKVFTKYWLALLAELFKNWNSVSFVDKTCYLECISRLMSRKEWIHYQDGSIYRDLLILTMNLIFKRLFNLKTLSISLNAFIGKTFCYAFFYVPKFAHILLFLLFVKNRSVQHFTNIASGIDSEKSSTYPQHLTHLINYKGDYDLATTDPKLSSNNCIMPPKVKTFLIQSVDDKFETDFTEVLEQHEELLIDLKDTNWVKRWAGFESDIFTTFLKHYLEVSLYYQQSQIDLNSKDQGKLSKFIENQPGGIIIHSHILQIFDSNCRMLKNFKRCQFKESSNPNTNNEMVAFYSSNIKNNTGKNYQNYLSGIPFLKFAKVLETLIYSSTYIDISLMIKYFESILLLRAKETSPFDPESCEVIYDILLQFCLRLNHNSKKPFYSNIGLIISNNDLLTHMNWEFWIIGLIQMVNTENMVCIAKSLSSLFNLWEIIPVGCYFDNQSLDPFSESITDISKELDWIIDRKYSMSYNLSMFLISDSVWEKLFIHWQPLIRHFYMRLLAFKIVGCSNENEVFSKIVKRKLNATYDLFLMFYKENKDYNSSLLKFEMLPSMPIFNKKLIITYLISDQSASASPIQKHSSTSTLQVNKRNKSYVDVLEKFRKELTSSSAIKNSYSSSTLIVPPTINTKRIYSYDIFDDAFYSSLYCGSPYSSQQSSSRSPSLNVENNKSNTSSVFSRSSIISLPSAARRESNPTSPSNGISRSSSSSTLKKVPIISSALSFFKKVNSSISNESRSPESTDLSDNLLKSPSIIPSRISPNLPSGRYFESPKVSAPSTPTSNSEVSDDDSYNADNHFNDHNFSRSSHAAALSLNSRHEFPQQQSLSSSRVSSATSLISVMSQNSNTPATTTSLTNNNPKASNSLNTMESVPPPPELFIKIPPSKSFKYKYQLIFSNDSFQNAFYQNKIANEPSAKKTLTYRVIKNYDDEDDDEPEKEKRQLFFRMDEIVDNADEIVPPKPRLPLDIRPNTTDIELMSNMSLSEDEEEEDRLGGDEGGKNGEELLKIRDSKLPDWLLSTPSTRSSASSLDSSMSHHKDVMIDLYQDVSNLDKNWTILGKVMNEWDLIVEEYEKYLEVLANDEKTELKNEDFYQWFSDPMLVCDIPPTKNMFGEKN
jgi:hypothetical protein